MTHARIGEIVVSRNPDDELVALGLGSCIGVVMIDAQAQVAGLAHVMLPESDGEAAAAGKFADTAVPQLVDRLRRAGAVDRRMEAVMAGGARMFEMSGGLDIGARNDHAAREALSRARIALFASQTGGNQGRTIKVSVGSGHVTVRIAGQEPVTLLEGRPAPTPRAAAAQPGTSRLTSGSAVSRMAAGGASAISSRRGPRAACPTSGAAL
jgi:chemotaxis protein CheD